MEQNNTPYSYTLPNERIAQRPLHPPEAAALVVVRGASRIVEKRTFRELPELLTANDLLVFNQTRVMAARLRGVIDSAKGGDAEFLLITEESPNIWRCLAKPLKKLEQGTLVCCSDQLQAKVVDRIAEKEILIEFLSLSQEKTVSELLEQYGEMPIPPYIRKGKGDSQDRNDYQSIFAKNPGSIAAPTASLHFSQTLVDQITERGTRTIGLTLHLGTASFLPVYSPETDILTPPGAERYVYSQAVLDQVAATKAAGGRVIAVGTSAVRALESMIRLKADDGEWGESTLFITPGFEFKAVDAIITNFHQPGTTHLLLVESFIGREMLAESYQYALENQVRFLSYGDGMILLRS